MTGRKPKRDTAAAAVVRAAMRWASETYDVPTNKALAALKRACARHAMAQRKGKR